MSIFKKLPIRWVFIVSGFIGLVQQRLEAQGSNLFQAIHGKVDPDDLVVDPYYVKGMARCSVTPRVLPMKLSVWPTFRL